MTVSNIEKVASALERKMMPAAPWYPFVILRKRKFTSVKNRNIKIRKVEVSSIRGFQMQTDALGRSLN